MRNLRSPLLTSLALATSFACAQRVQPPTANAGPGQQVNAGSFVKLDGSGSKDPSGSLLAYSWQFNSRPTTSQAQLSDPHAVSPSFLADAAGDYVIQLVVSNSVLVSTPSNVTISASSCGVNKPVVKSLTPSRPNGSVVIGNTVSIKADVTDVDNTDACGNLGKTLSYQYTLVSQPPKSTALLNNANSEVPSLTVDISGNFVIRLVVTDSTHIVSDPKDITIFVNDCGANAPSVKVSPETSSINPRATATFSATPADDDAKCGVPETFTYAWRVTERPLGSNAVLNPSTSMATLTPDLPGLYTVSVVATDNTGLSSQPALAALTVSACSLVAPVIGSIFATGTGLNDAIQVQANGIIDANCVSIANAYTYDWKLIPPPASNALLDDPTMPTPTFTADVVGAYQLSVAVTNSEGRTSARLYKTLNVKPCGTSAIQFGETPIDFTAANPSTLPPVLGSILTLTAHPIDGNTSCGKALPFAYRWWIVSKPSSSTSVLSGSGDARPTFSPDVAGTYLVGVIVSDALKNTSAPAYLALQTSLCGIQAPTVSSGPVAVPPSLHIGGATQLSAVIADPDNDVCGLSQTLTYNWQILSMPNGSKVKLNDNHAATPTFTSDRAGDYVVQLIVTDSTGLQSAPATVTVNSDSCGNAVPGLSAKVFPASADPGTTVQLTATGSSPDFPGCAADPIGYVYKWRLSSRPLGSTALLSDPNSRTPTFAGDLKGLYEFSVTVTAPNGLTSLEAFTVLSVDDCAELAPSIDALKVLVLNRDVSAGMTVGTQVMSLALVSDNNCKAVAAQEKFAWTLRGPNGSSAVLDNPSAATPNFTPDLTGNYQLSLVVTNSVGRSSDPAFLTVPAAPCTDKPVLSKARFTGPALTGGGTATTIFRDDQVNLAVDVTPGTCGRGSAAFTYHWAFTSASGGSTPALSSSTDPTPFFIAGTAGATYQLVVQVTDALGNVSPPAVVTVPVSQCGAFPLKVTIAPDTSTGPSKFDTGAPQTLTASATTLDNNNGICPPRFNVKLTQVNYSWSRLSGLPTSTLLVSAPPSTTATFTAQDPGDSIVQVTGTVGNKTGTASASLTAFLAPQAPAISAPAFATVSPTAGPQNAFTASVQMRPGMSYGWLVNGSASIVNPHGSAGEVAGNTNSITIVDTVAEAVSIFCIELNGNFSNSTPGSATTTVVPAAVRPTVGTNAFSPDGGTTFFITTGLTYTASITSALNPGASYSFSATGASILTGAASTTSISFVGTGVGPVTISAFETNAAGQQSSPGSVAITDVDPAPAPLLTGLQANLTAGISGYALTASGLPGAPFACSASNGTVAPRAGTFPTSSPSVQLALTPANPGTVTVSCVQANAANTPSSAATASGTAFAAAVTPIVSAPASATEGKTYSASVPTNPGATYTWSVDGSTATITSAGGASGVTSPDGKTNSIRFSSGSANPAVVQRNIFCIETNAAKDSSSDPGTAIVNVYPAAKPPTIIASSPVTVGTTNVVKVAARSGAFTYAWEASGATITENPASGSSIHVVAPAAPGSFVVTATESNGVGDSFATASATINAVAAPAVGCQQARRGVAAPGPACSLTITLRSPVTTGQQYTASVNATPGMSYLWSIGDGSIVGSAAGVTSANSATNTVTFSAGSTTGTQALSLQVFEINAAGTQSTPAALAFADVIPPPAAVGVSLPAKMTVGVPSTATVSGGFGNAYNCTTSNATPGTPSGNLNGGADSFNVTPGSPGTVTVSCTQTDAGGTTGPAGSASSTAYPQPLVGLAITAPAAATTGKTYVASVPAQFGSTYQWTIDVGGTIVGAGGTGGTTSGGLNLISFTAGSPGTRALNCTETTGNNLTGNAPAKTVTVYGAALTPAINAANDVTETKNYPAFVNARDGYTYTWVISQGLFGAGTTTSVPNASGQNTVTFTAGAANANNSVVILTLAVTETSPAGDSSATGLKTINLWHLPRAGMTVAFLSGKGSALPTQQFLTENGKYVAQVGALANMGYAWSFTNAGLTPRINAPVSNTGTTTCDLVGCTNSIPFFTDFSNGNPDGGTGADGGPATVVTAKVTETNKAGDSSSAAPGNLGQATLVPAPQASNLAAVPGSIFWREQSQLTPNFFNGTGSIDQGVGAVTSGVSKPVTPPVGLTTYTLTVQNLAQDKSSQPATVFASNDGMVALGAKHGCQINNTGAINCWGDNSTGQLGTGDEVAVPGGAVPTTDGGTFNTDAGAPAGWNTVAAGRGHSCAVASDGRLFCWGDNSSGQLAQGAVGGIEPDAGQPEVAVGGDGGIADALALSQIGTDTDWVIARSFNNTTCALKGDQSLWCWGDNTFGQLGRNSHGGAVATVQREATNNLWRDYSVGNSHVCAIAANGSLWCWGDNQSGQAGQAQNCGGGQLCNNDTPQQVGAFTDWTAVAAGDIFSCAVRGATGDRYCWGSSAGGRWGDNSPVAGTLQSQSPVFIESGYRRVSAGDGFGCGVKTDGTSVFCWGSNSNGQLGSGTVGVSTSTPALVSPSLGSDSVATNGSTTCAATISPFAVKCTGAAKPVTTALKGSYTVNQGPSWSSQPAPATYNCIEGCAQVFGGVSTQYSCSTSSTTIDHQGWMDGYGSTAHCSSTISGPVSGATPVSETFKTWSTYVLQGGTPAYSAYVTDHRCTSTNYCFITQ